LANCGRTYAVLVTSPIDLRRPSPAALKLIYDEVADALEKQFEQIESLNARSQQLIGFAAIAVGILIGLRPPARGELSVTLFSIALFVFAVIAAAGLRAWALQGWRADPDARTLWEKDRLHSEEWLRHQIILNRLEAVDANATAVAVKLFWVRWTQRLLAVEVVYLTALAIIRPYL
jgi:hypothetical protein